ncbi:hypothetical protein PINS_up000868 [Pythium insidiosum]|nr:hypothetical protein PINS_up000868 [Pythium insidiosum]
MSAPNNHHPVGGPYTGRKSKWAAPPTPSDDFPVVLLEDDSLYRAPPRGRGVSQGIVLYDPMQSSPNDNLQTKNVALLQAPAPPSLYAVNNIRLPPRSNRAMTVTSQSTATSSTGAIRPGGAVNIFSLTYIGLVFNYFVVGIVDGLARALIYPFFRTYLHLSDHQQQSALALFAFGWCFKFVFGYLSDCLTITRLRRKPYMIVGHVLLLCFEIGIAVIPQIEPYWKDGRLNNPKAADESPRYLVPVMFGSFGHVILSIATEAMMVEHAHRESEFARGTIQCTIYAIRYIGEMFSTLVVALMCNSNEYGGSFSFSLSANSLIGSISIFSIIGIYATLRHIHEEPLVGRQRFYSHMRSIWRIVEQRATWQVTLFGFLQAFCFMYKVPEQDTIYENWLNGDTLSRNLSSVGMSLAYAIAIYSLQTDALRNYSWCRLAIISTLVCTVTSLTVSLLLVFDVVRSKPLFLIDQIILAGGDAVVWMTRILVIVEIAEPGYEATSYALVTAIQNLAVPLATATSSAMSSAFGVTAKEVEQDTREVRREVMGSYLVMFGLRVIVGLAILVLLPDQKRATRKLKLLGSPNLVVPIVLAIVFSIIYVLTWTSIAMSVL